MLVATASRSVDTLNPRVRTVVLVYPSMFVAEINANSTGGGVLTIKCVEDCKRYLRFRETVDYYPVSIVPLDAGAPMYLATTWATGTAFVSRLYRIDLGDIRFINEAYSYHQPIYGVNGRGRFVVTCQGNYWATCKYVTFYLTDHSVVRVPGFVMQR